MKASTESTASPAIKRFAVFSGDQFYPNGGWLDYRGSCDTLEEALRLSAPGDWRQIIDLSTGKWCLDEH